MFPVRARGFASHFVALWLEFMDLPVISLRGATFLKKRRLRARAHDHVRKTSKKRCFRRARGWLEGGSRVVFACFACFAISDARAVHFSKN